MRLKIDWASLTVGSKFTVFACFTLYLRAISKYNPPGGLYLEGLIHGGAYFRNFTVSKKENIYGVNKTPKNPKKRKRYTTISKNVVGRKAKILSQD